MQCDIFVFLPSTEFKQYVLLSTSVHTHVQSASGLGIPIRVLLPLHRMGGRSY